MGEIGGNYCDEGLTVAKVTEDFFSPSLRDFNILVSDEGCRASTLQFKFDLSRDVVVLMMG